MLVLTIGVLGLLVANLTLLAVVMKILVPMIPAILPQDVFILLFLVKMTMNVLPINVVPLMAVPTPQ